MTPQSEAIRILELVSPHAYMPNPIFNTNPKETFDHDIQLAIIVAEECKNNDEMGSKQCHDFWDEVIKEIQKLKSNYVQSKT